MYRCIFFDILHVLRMLGQLAKEHIQNRLKAVQLGGIFFMVSIFVILFIIGRITGLTTLPAQLITLTMAFFISLGYFSALPQSSEEPKTPLVILYIINILTAGLIWATGIFQSPFILLYPVIIIITAQLYSYRHGLVHAVLAIIGFVFVYGATIENILPFLPILPRASIDSLYQPPLNIILYGFIYLALFLFTLYSSSSARAILYKPSKKMTCNKHIKSASFKKCLLVFLL